MKIEVQRASNFLTNMLRIHYSSSSLHFKRFYAALQHLLLDRYQQHWFPESPSKGSGYRCIRVNHNMDPILARAAQVAGIADEELRRIIPSELTVWVDPCEVSYRIGENGSICPLYPPSYNPSLPMCATPKRRRRGTISSDDDSSISSSPTSSSSVSCSPTSSSSPISCSSLSTSPMSPSSSSPSESSFLMDPENVDQELDYSVDS